MNTPTTTRRRVMRIAAAGGLVIGLVAGAPAAPRQGPVPPPVVPGLLPPPPQPPPSARPAELRATIPAGEFWMGRTRLWLMDEIGWQIRERFDDRPVHRVRLAAFRLDVYEVTNGDYARFVATPGAQAEAPYHWGGPTPPAGKEHLPVYNVTWHEAAAYCAAQGGRLPTEAEWEYAARGGVADLDYPWGNDYADETAPAPRAAASAARPGRHAHSGSSTGPVPVGTFAPNPFGLHDVSGNLWEWTADWYDLTYYSESPVDNPTGPATGHYKVIRGGSWADTETRLGTVYYRNFTAPDTAQPTIGFRCASPAPATR